MMADKDKDRESVNVNLRSILVTAKNGLPLRSVERDYEEIIGKRIPYRDFGYSNLKLFLLSIPEVKIFSLGNEEFVKAFSEAAAHISKLVSGQKNSKKSRGRPQIPRYNRTYVIPSRARLGSFESRRYPITSAPPPMARNVTHYPGTPSPPATSYKPMGSPQMPRNVAHYPGTPSAPATSYKPMESPQMPRNVTHYPGTPSPPATSYKPIGSPQMPRNVVRYPAAQSTHETSQRPVASLTNGKTEKKTIVYTPPSSPSYKQTSTPLETPQAKLRSALYSPPHTPLRSTGTQKPVESKTENQNMQQNGGQTSPKSMMTASYYLDLIKTNGGIPRVPSFNEEPQSPKWNLDRLTELRRPKTPNDFSFVQPGPGYFSAPVRTSPEPKIAFPNAQSRLAPALLPTPVRISPEPWQNDAQSKLRWFAQEKSWPEPEYKVLPAANKRFYAQVIIGNNKFSSYPNEAESENSAKNFAAEHAVNSLAKNGFSEPKMRETADKELIKKRVSDMVLDSRNGVIADEMNNLYSKKFGEILPKDWLDLIKESDTIAREEQYYSANDKTLTILFPHDPKTVEIATEKEVPNAAIDEDKLCTIIRIENANEIWASYKSTDLRFMNDNLRLHYSKHREMIKLIRVGKYYALNENGEWHRGKCLAHNIETEKAMVFLIDTGKEMEVATSNLYRLHEQFYDLPAQVFRLALYELQEWSDFTQLIPIMKKHLFGKALLAAVSEDNLRDQKGTYQVATFYDSETRREINLDICNEFMAELASTSRFNLVQGSLVFNARLANITDSGDVYLQAEPTAESVPTLETFTLMLSRLVEDAAFAESSPDHIESESMCYVKNAMGYWNRGNVIRILAIGQIEVFLVDHGITIFVSAADIVSCHRFPTFLSNYPLQALNVELHNIPDKLLVAKIERFKELASELLLVKIVTPEIDKSPKTMIVELFKRIQPHDMLVSINDTLLLEPTLTQQNSVEQKPSSPKAKPNLSRTILPYRLPILGNGDKVLRPPELPTKASDYFDIHATLVANPSRFVVQPHESKSQLLLNQQEMQEVYVQSENAFSSSEDVKEGDLVAARYSDKFWYRACILKIMNDSQVSVLLCDYGNIEFCSIENLRPLNDEFLDLPYQALKAKLFGVKPKNSDWEMEAVEYFHSIVNEKNFVSHIKGSCIESGEVILELELIDTSTEVDVYIDEELVSKFMAIAETSTIET